MFQVMIETSPSRAPSLVMPVSSTPSSEIEASSGVSGTPLRAQAQSEMSASQRTALGYHPARRVRCPSSGVVRETPALASEIGERRGMDEVRHAREIDVGVALDLPRQVALVVAGA